MTDSAPADKDLSASATDVDTAARQDKVPTVDGTRLELADLNVAVENPAENEAGGPIRRFGKRLSQFLAGMYTGVKCGGTPHSHHTYNRDHDDRPI